ncbi:FHA domain-containing protein PS1 isoform X3 [Manihot esculenta]|uniref:Uncharacterized protein n=1 Tax=Manihot esculenta TaxID=3983 RepID=A0ACB7FZY2_MANES|nr:FHA domain-containing protein PS1 isoform X3 [Manihot esculenta]KAG8633390.1 hypothetical protein MANES_18G099700v8 [Manihot esculenta]
MGSIEERKRKEEERKIPLFTVLKNGAILKNIFVINKQLSPSPELNSIAGIENLENPDGENEEILIVGRHPDCSIVLMHPSISRFHLQINSVPSEQKLFVTDLSSVHGTWVSEKKIEPGLRVELNEGGTLRVGGSTRVYRLHWVPLSRAYDLENPFVSEEDLAITEEKEEENIENLSQDEDLENKNAEEKDSLIMDMNSMSSENGEIQSTDSNLECIVSLFPDENCGLIVEKAIPSSPSMPEDMNSCFYKEKEELEGKSGSDHELSPNIVEGVIFQTSSLQFYECNQSPEYHSAKEAILEEYEYSDISETRLEPELNVELDKDASSSVAESDISKTRLQPESNVELNKDSSLSVAEVESNSASEIPKEIENQTLLRKGDEQGENTPKAFENKTFTIGDLSEHNNEQFNKENLTPEPSVALRQLLEEQIRENSTENLILNMLVSPQNYDPAAAEIREEMENQSPSRKDDVQNEFSSTCHCVPPLATESVNSSLPLAVLPEIVDSRESQTPQSNFPAVENTEKLRSPPIRSEKKSSSCSIWSRRGKPATPLQLQTSKSRARTKRIDADIGWENQEDVENKSITRALFSGSEAMDEEIFTPDKENHTPNTFVMKALKMKGTLQDTQLSKLCRSSSSKFTFSPNIVPEDMIASSDKENQTPQVLRQRKSAKPTLRKQVKLEEESVLKERRAERIPLQSLFANSPGKSISEASVLGAAARSSNSISCTQKVKNSTSINSVGDGERRWTMIADTTSLLDKESRKSLQLLQGLKGTHLVIPRMVITELDSLKRRGSLFRRTTEASLALKWIEECMVKTKWWIQVQSSIEDQRLIAPTPTAFPVSPSGTTSSVSFLAYGSLMEIVSPTAEDHILDCALSYRKMNVDGQLVFLSNDVTLKIKAKAEGLICETAEEFRDSLTNPFSERFLWADSSPRGQTWTVLDDVVLKEKYYRSPSKKSSSKGEGAKGLKLILLYNSQYGQQMGNTVP